MTCKQSKTCFQNYVCEDVSCTPTSARYRRRGKLRVGKVSRIPLYFAYRRKSFAMLILHTNLLLYKYKHVEANRRKSFAIATAIAKIFPRVTFPA